MTKPFAYLTEPTFTWTAWYANETAFEVWNWTTAATQLTQKEVDEWNERNSHMFCLSIPTGTQLTQAHINEARRKQKETQMNCKECGAKMVKVNYYVWKCTGVLDTYVPEMKRICNFRTTTNTSERIRSLVETRKWNGSAAKMRRINFFGNVEWVNAPIACPYAGGMKDFYV